MNTVLLSFSVAWIVLNIIGNYFLFKKAGKPGWHSLIPFLNTYDEFDMCWDGKKGILYLLLLIGVNAVPSTTQSTVVIVLAFLAAMWLLSLHFRQSMRLAKSFGKGSLYGLFLFFFNGIGKMILGLGNSQYLGEFSYSGRSLRREGQMAA